MKNSANSEVPRLETATASRGSNFFIGTRRVGAGASLTPGAADLKFEGLYLSAPGGMLTWIGIYPFPVLARLLAFLTSGAGGGTGLRGLELPDELLLLRPLSPRLVSLAIKLGALAFFLGGRLKG